jgi:hypothetical protein
MTNRLATTFVAIFATFLIVLGLVGGIFGPFLVSQIGLGFSSRPLILIKINSLPA